MAAPKILVAFPRTRKLNTHGRDVQQDRRAMTRAGFWPVNHNTKPPSFYDSPEFTHKFALRVRAYQRSKKLKVTGEIDRATHNSLATPYRDPKGRLHAYGRYGKAGALVMADVTKKLRAQERLLLRAGSVEDRTCAAALLCVRHRSLIHYTQGSLRMTGVTRRMYPPAYPRYIDCSAAYTWWKFVGGAPDPNGLGYNGQGYTGTQSNKGVTVAPWNAPRTAAVFYGRPIGHVAMIVVKGSKVVSHGSEIGPVLVNVGYRPPVLAKMHSNRQRPGFTPWAIAKASG